MTTHAAEEVVIQHLRGMGALLRGHFIGNGGSHLDEYLDKDVPTRYPARLRGLVRRMGADLPMVNIVVAPPMGALSMGTMLAEELEAQYAYLEVGPRDSLRLVRGTFLEGVAGMSVGICEDIVTDGGTTRKSVEAVQQAGGNVEWVTALWNRKGQTADSVGVPLFLPLVDRQLPSWNAAECPLCRDKVPVRRRPGHGHKREAAGEIFPGGYAD